MRKLRYPDESVESRRQGVVRFKPPQNDITMQRGITQRTFRGKIDILFFEKLLSNS